MLYYNSFDTNCKCPFGAISNKDTLEISIFAKDGVFVKSAFLCLNLDGFPTRYTKLNYIKSENGYSKFSISLTLPVGLYWYYFKLDTENGAINYYKGNRHTCAQDSKTCYQLTVFDVNYTTPNYAKGGIIYHIFADRFAKGNDEACKFVKDGTLKDWGAPLTLSDEFGNYWANDFYGGNLQGITDKIPYLKKLNVSIIYLSPIFKSYSNHRYDTGDYMQIDELLGDTNSFKKLIDTAKENNIQIMLDGVFNHTGADSLYFNKRGSYNSVGAYQSKNSPYYKWYSFTNFPDEYNCWWGITVTPTVNKRNKDYQNFIFGKNGVLEKWTALGVKGWRLDVVDELEEQFVQNIRSCVKNVNSDALILGEVWEDASNKIAYSTRRKYFLGKELDGVMNYPFKNAILAYTQDNNIDYFKDIVENILENYPKQSLHTSMTFIDTHDTYRAINVFYNENLANTTKADRQNIVLSGDKLKLALDKMKLASVLQFTLPGIPSIFYGDEVGLSGYDDPLNRGTFPWDNINQNLLAHYQLLSSIRTKYQSLFTQSFSFEEGEMLIYNWRNSTEEIKIIVNNTNQTQFYTTQNKYYDLYNAVALTNTLECPPASFNILKKL
ncbi:MAG: glycoside hydrolase family 13 protein [Clostridia bacterium]